MWPRVSITVFHQNNIMFRKLHRLLWKINLLTDRHTDLPKITYRLSIVQGDRLRWSKFAQKSSNTSPGNRNCEVWLGHNILKDLIWIEIDWRPDWTKTNLKKPANFLKLPAHLFLSTPGTFFHSKPSLLVLPFHFTYGNSSFTQQWIVSLKVFISVWEICLRENDDENYPTHWFSFYQHNFIDQFCVPAISWEFPSFFAELRSFEC